MRVRVCGWVWLAQALDADVLVGHNIGGYDLPTLLGRMQHHKVASWVHRTVHACTQGWHGAPARRTTYQPRLRGHAIAVRHPGGWQSS